MIVLVFGPVKHQLEIVDEKRRKVCDLVYVLNVNDTRKVTIEMKKMRVIMFGSESKPFALNF